MKQDTIILGMLAGFAGNLPKELLAWGFHLLGYLRYTFVHIAAGAFVPSEFLDSPISLLTGFFSDWILAGLMGVMILKIIRITGSDFPILKSIGISSILYIFLYGVLMALNITRASLLTPLPNFILLFPHLLFGMIVGFFIKHFNKIY